MVIISNATRKGAGSRGRTLPEERTGSPLTSNARSKRAKNPLRSDPSRTATLRRLFEAELRRRFARVAKQIQDLLLVEDAFGLVRESTIATNARWVFQSRPQQIAAFLKWLQGVLKDEVLAGKDDGLGEAYWRKFVQEAYQKGQGRAFDDVRVPAVQKDMRWYNGTKEEFLRSSFGRPMSIEKVQLMAGRVFTDLKGVTEAMAVVVSRELTEGFARGDNPHVLARRLKDDLGFGSNRAATIARSEVIRAHAEGQLDAMERLGVTEVGVMVEWDTAGDGRVCKLCQAMDGVVLTIKEARGMIPRHPNCLPGDSLVSSSSRILAVSKRWFDGDLIIVKTASGRELSCTPNHPILTDHGWVPAESLDLASKVVCDGGGEWERVANGQDQDVVSSIHDVAEAFFGSGEVASAPVPLSTIDFHGDAANGQVAVIGTHCSLLVHGNAPIFQGVQNSDLSRGDITRDALDSSGVEALGLMRDSSSSGCLICGGDLPGTGRSTHRGPLEQFSLGLTPDVYPPVFEPLVDYPSTDPEFIGKLLGRFAPDVFFDDVVDVHRCPVSCHVYNLQTESEWYTAGGIVTHNCRCAHLPANVGEPQKEQVRRKEQIQAAITESLKAEKPKKRTLAEQRKRTKWVGPDKRIAKKRPISVVNYNPNQPRDAQGRWGSGGGGSLKLPAVGEAVSVKGSKYWAEPFDSDDAFPPAIAQYEIQDDGTIFYTGRNGSEGVVTGTPEQAAKWMADVREEVTARPPSSHVSRDWSPEDGGAENIAMADAVVKKTADTFAIEAPTTQFYVVEKPLESGSHGPSSVSLANAHESSPMTSLRFKTDASQQVHTAAHETVHAVYATAPDIGAIYMGELSNSGESISLYHDLGGHHEGLMDLGASYVHSPAQLKEYSPALYSIADRWAQAMSIRSRR